MSDLLSLVGLVVVVLLLMEVWAPAMRRGAPALAPFTSTTSREVCKVVPLPGVAL